MDVIIHIELDIDIMATDDNAISEEIVMTYLV